MPWEKVTMTIGTKQAASIIGVGTSRIYHLIKQRRLPAQKFGRDWMILEVDAIAYKPNKVGRPRKERGNV